MAEYDLRFAQTADGGPAFRLLELPPELYKLVEAAVDGAAPSLSIKGHATEDAVLCTANKTYALRSVVLSNSVLVVGPRAPPEAGDLAVRGELHEVLELVPCVPKLHRLAGLLRGLEYDERHEDEGMDSGDEDEEQVQVQPRRRVTYADAREEIQASEVELAQGLRDWHILVLDDCLRPITPAYLCKLLELLLNTLAALAQPHTAASVEDLCAALADEHQVRRAVALQTMAWFGTVDADGPAARWAMDVDAVLRQIGLGLLSGHKDEPIDEDEFIARWRAVVGDTFQEHVVLVLLSGNYLRTTVPGSYPPTDALTFFPAAALPADPAARFGDLFAARARWAGDEIGPFLADVAVDGKARDRLLLKYARATTGKDGVWYTVRAQYNG